MSHVCALFYGTTSLILSFLLKFIKTQILSYKIKYVIFCQKFNFFSRFLNLLLLLKLTSQLKQFILKWVPI